MAKDEVIVPLAFRCPKSIVDSIHREMKLSKRTKTDVAVARLKTGISNVDILDRSALPDLPGLYIVYKVNGEPLHFGRADNLRKRWASHPRFQEFVDTARDCRIAFFPLDSADKLEAVTDEFENEPLETAGQRLVTYDEYLKLEQRVVELEQLVSGRTAKKKEQPERQIPTPRGLQQWEIKPVHEEEGISRSELFRKFGFRLSEELKATADKFGLSPDEYLAELSGWEVEGPGRKANFYPPKS